MNVDLINKYMDEMNYVVDRYGLTSLEGYVRMMEIESKVAYSYAKTELTAHEFLILAGLINLSKTKVMENISESEVE